MMLWICYREGQSWGSKAWRVASVCDRGRRFGKLDGARRVVHGVRHRCQQFTFVRDRIGTGSRAN